MNSKLGFSIQNLLVIGICALMMLCIFEATSVGQQPQRPLFVIKPPVVQELDYGKRFDAPKAFPVSFRVQEEEAPLEDDSPEDDSLSVVDDLLNDDLPDEDDEPIQIQMTEWSLKPMSSINPRIRSVSGKTPADRSSRLTNRGSMPFSATSKVFAWAAPNINYEPLFFEDVALERYGQTRGLIRQPFVSAAEYLKSAAFLPYASIYDPIDSCDYPLGYCRPGDSVQCVKQKHFFGNPFQTRR